ncbi:MAG TPA: SDR family oxidoreductase [Gemmatimonadaceae bacterium]|nr:SDR family oxidoreductase [Gemmatimonadaceae bacterium]
MTLVRFEGDAVVITGVGRRGQAGEVVARRFAELGAAVHCIDRDAGVNEVAETLASAGIAPRAHQVDLTDAGATAQLASSIAAAHGGRVAAVAAIAGGFAHSGPIADSDPAVLARQVAINLTSAYCTARAFAPSVRAARGAFVFATSAAVLPGGRVAGLSAYAAAKGGLVQLMRALAQEEREYGVRVNAVAPTALRTAANVAGMGRDVRYVELSEFADAIVTLCSSGFARATGQVIELA